MGHRCCGKQKVKRGLWSPEEDEKLLSFITCHGHSSWSAVPKLAGLERCGKSCRLRWINYLRPDLKRGSFTEEEERTIIEVHRILGNRWAQIAKHLPGRTDNEVKNFWNSCIKKKLLAHGFDPNTHNLLPATSKPSPASRVVRNHKQARRRHHDHGHDPSSPAEVFTVDTVRPHKKGDTHPPLGASTNPNPNTATGTSSFDVSHSTSGVAHGFGITDQPSIHTWDDHDHLQLQHTNTNTTAGIMEESELQMLSTLQMPAAQSFDHLPPFMGNNAAGSDFDFGFGDYDAIIQSGIYGDALTSMDHLAWDIAN